MKELHTDVLIVGGSLGGVAAALAAVRLGRRVIVTEETDWIGGQLTAQAVPPDEHPWIESTGSTATYRRLRHNVRAFYRRNYPLLPGPRQDPHFNPGMADVSRLSHEPRVGLAALVELLAPFRSTGQIDVRLRHRPVCVETDGDRIRAVTIQDCDTNELKVVTAPYTLDATDLGDLLDLACVEHVIGAESQADTGELHALAGPPQPGIQQAITWCFALDYLPGEDNTIAMPEEYDFWRGYRAPFWPGPQLGWDDIESETLEPRHYPLFDGPTDRETGDDFWHFRRILYRKHFPEGLYRSDICLVNWPQIDYFLGPIVGVSEEDRALNLGRAKQLSLSMLYWMQTEAPRHDGGHGYPGLRLRPDIVGTTDGLAKSVYVRESRRIRAEFTVLEQHVGVAARAPLCGAERFEDTVGVGSYRIDLHPRTGPHNYVDVSSWPFQIPLGALIPVRLDNFLPACKNLGVTHITNGCYRLHPVEWNIGEVAGALAAYCLNRSLSPREVRNTPSHLADFQSLLDRALGIQLAWPDYSPR